MDEYTRRAIEQSNRNILESEKRIAELEAHTRKRQAQLEELRAARKAREAAIPNFDLFAKCPTLYQPSELERAAMDVIAARNTAKAWEEHDAFMDYHLHGI